MYDDLIGNLDDDDDSPQPYTGKKRGRPPGVRNKQKPLYPEGGANDQLGEVMSGVTMKWIQMVFGLERKVVARAIEGMKPVRITGNVAYYSLREVMPYVVAPKMKVEEYLETISPDQLPEHLRETYWNVQAKSQKVRVAAGDLWRTEDVIEVIGETFKDIKNTIMLWADTIEEQTDLTDEQRRIIISLTDELRQDLYQSIVKRAAESRTRSQLKELDVKPEANEDDYEDL